MTTENGKKVHLHMILPPHVKVEIRRLQILLGKSSMSGVMEELLEVYHSTARGDPALWEVLKASVGGQATSQGGG